MKVNFKWFSESVQYISNIQKMHAFYKKRLLFQYLSLKLKLFFLPHLYNNFFFFFSKSQYFIFLPTIPTKSIKTSIIRYMVISISCKRVNCLIKCKFKTKTKIQQTMRILQTQLNKLYMKIKFIIT